MQTLLRVKASNTKVPLGTSKRGKCNRGLDKGKANALRRWQVEKAYSLSAYHPFEGWS